ncbi:glycosyltransferase family 2 protein [Candidatus Parcubacteria bacterium]|nr:MAG: glycosyltransferase family 2 protein [Candidatus Parcubacteria bacterium]
MKKLSVVLAVYNEETNLATCLKSVKDIADEIIIVDGGSTDKTVEIAKSFNAEVIITDNPPIFHINKQKALEQATGEWILQLDADEVISNQLADEIIKIIHMTNMEIVKYEESLPKRNLFLRHQKLLVQRDDNIGIQEGPFNAFFFPRLNYFLGKYLRYGGVYPDGVIRLVKKGKAHFPCKSVHEQIIVEGRAGWLQNDLIHMADPTFKRYLERNNRYIELIAKELRQDKTPRGLWQFFDYFLFKPLSWFLMTQIRNKGILDGYQGIIFSFFSALRFPRAYWRYIFNK